MKFFLKMLEGIKIDTGMREALYQIYLFEVRTVTLIVLLLGIASVVVIWVSPTDKKEVCYFGVVLIIVMALNIYVCFKATILKSKIEEYEKLLTGEELQSQREDYKKL